MEHDVVRHHFVREMANRLIGTLIWRSLTPNIQHINTRKRSGSSLRQRPINYRLMSRRDLEAAKSCLTFRCRGLRGCKEMWRRSVIGPAASPDAERTLRKFLSTVGIEFIKISRSDIPGIVPCKAVAGHAAGSTTSLLMGIANGNRTAPCFRKSGVFRRAIFFRE